jgi:tRNA U34 5-carboxymethylaminomethyl modifying GTPase MnmE/TrmE
LSDLPGYGTSKCPAATCLLKFEIAKFDIFLCVALGKLKDDDISFFRELIHAGKRCVFVRNKVETEFELGATADEMRARIAASICEQVGSDAKVVFTSCRTMQGLDELQAAIMGTLSGVKRDRFLRSAAAYQKNFLMRSEQLVVKLLYVVPGYRQLRTWSLSLHLGLRPKSP